MRSLAFAVAVLMAIAMTANAQQPSRKKEQEWLALLAGAGAVCDSIWRAVAIGQLENEDILMAIACKDKNEYVIKIDRRDNAVFFATCADFERTNPTVKCFR